MNIGWSSCNDSRARAGLVCGNLCLDRNLAGSRGQRALPSSDWFLNPFSDHTPPEEAADFFLLAPAGDLGEDLFFTTRRRSVHAVSGARGWDPDHVRQAQDRFQTFSSDRQAANAEALAMHFEI